MRRILGGVVVLIASMLAAQVVVPSAPSVIQLKQKAAAGDVQAQIALARAYERGEGVPQNEELAVKWYRAAAEQGDATAQNDLGVMYRMGHGVERDYAQAREWYMKAAQQKNAAALFNLGTLYYNGDGVTIDDERAYAYFVLAQEAGSKDAAAAVQRMNSELSPVKLGSARFFLAELLETQAGNEGRALKIYEELAQQGEPTAQLRAARMYLDGRGTPKNVARARAWCDAAAQEKVSPGMVCLGYLDLTGEGQAYKSALRWYEKAAQNGNAVAMYSLGVMYAKGMGVKQDNAKAYLWFAMAARGRLGLANAAMDRLRPNLKKGQAENAERQAKLALVFSVQKDPDSAEFSRSLPFD